MEEETMASYNQTEEYDGTSWTEQNNKSTARTESWRSRNSNIQQYLQVDTPQHTTNFNSESYDGTSLVSKLLSLSTKEEDQAWLMQELQYCSSSLWWDAYPLNNRRIYKSANVITAAAWASGTAATARRWKGTSRFG